MCASTPGRLKDAQHHATQEQQGQLCLLPPFLMAAILHCCTRTVRATASSCRMLTWSYTKNLQPLGGQSSSHTGRRSTRQAGEQTGMQYRRSMCCGLTCPTVSRRGALSCPVMLLPAAAPDPQRVVQGST
jgi:hypothetical protein